MSNLSLNNINNYNLKYTNSISEIYTKYVTIISEYLIQVKENLYMKDEIYFKYIINKGIETISHVFKLLLLYTKNLEICYYYSQKAYFYYTEFIGQIVQIDQEHQTYLQLNCKDASLFVYKKTLFEINNDFKKNFISNKEDVKIIDTIDVLINLYNDNIILLINQFNFLEQNKNNIFNEIDNKLVKIVANLVNLSYTNNFYDKLIIVYKFYNSLKIDNKFIYLELFLKKIQKYKITFQELNDNLNNDNISDYICNENKYINLLFNIK
tara:strand:- start:13605 stop:14405 length:801 start_codon:yes stop_codon:yes gene_type:complete